MFTKLDAVELLLLFIGAVVALGALIACGRDLVANI